MSNRKESMMSLVVASNTGFSWFVFDSNSKEVASGHTSTHDHAVRAARNFIKRNQNLVYL